MIIDVFWVLSGNKYQQDTLLRLYKWWDKWKTSGSSPTKIWKPLVYINCIITFA